MTETRGSVIITKGGINPKIIEDKSNPNPEHSLEDTLVKEAGLQRQDSLEEEMIQLENLLSDLRSWDESNMSDPPPYDMGVTMRPKATRPRDKTRRESFLAAVLAASEKDNSSTSSSKLSVRFSSTIKINDDLVKVSGDSKNTEKNQASADTSQVKDDTVGDKSRESQRTRTFKPTTYKFQGNNIVATIDIPLDHNGRCDPGTLQHMIRDCKEIYIKVRVPNDLQLDDFNIKDIEREAILQKRIDSNRTITEYYV